MAEFRVTMTHVESGKSITFDDDDCLPNGLTWNVETDIKDVTPPDSTVVKRETTGYSRMLLQARFREGHQPKWTETDKGE
jgi:hypothetical protein